MEHCSTSTRNPVYHYTYVRESGKGGVENSEGWKTYPGKDLAPYRIGKHSNPQSSPKIHQKYFKKYDFRYFFGVFCPILLVGAFSYSVRGQVFRKTYRKFGVKPLPKNVFGPPPPPLFGDSLSFPLRKRGTDQTNPNF